ncbi:MAG: glycosyltransferase family 39 protein [Chloroflexi bacterium]|nr:glycosyltransferase family 39 protein [Chloroflexota bacterium]
MTREKHSWLYDLLFLLVFLLAGYLRLTGVNWGEGQHQHPDENFLTGVLGSLRAQVCADASTPADACPPDQKRWLTLGEYFDSRTSPLNPYNRGYNFFVYGNLPMTIVRLAVDATGQLDVKTLGRQFSALADLFTLFFLYLLVSRMYGRRVALLASLFSALTVMQIQQSHFFTTDLFVNAFAFLAIYFVVQILDAPAFNDPSPLTHHFTHPLFLHSLGFGFAFGMAMASKVNIYPLAFLLPGAFAIRYLTVDRGRLTGSPPLTNYYFLITACLLAGGLAALLSFRIFQPYAFDGILPNEQWIANIQEQRIQAKGDADLPWNLQWARRSHLYSFENLTIWGLGLPLGILAWSGFLYMGWRILKGEWRHALLWGWTAAYFLWQSLQFNPTMRYQLPIYPLLAMMAAWFVFEQLPLTNYRLLKPANILRGILAVLVVVLTAAWAFAFHNIYLRDEPRIAASRWIFQNVPGPINIGYQTANGNYNQPLPFPSGGFIQAGAPYETTFIANTDGLIQSITLGYAANTSASLSTLSLLLSEQPNPTPEQTLATAATLTADLSPRTDPRGQPLTLTFDKPIPASRGQQYFLRFELDAGRLLINGSAIANETDYDYGLPFRIDGYDAFGGIYRGDLNLQVYWDDNEDKLNRFVNTLAEADYLFIPTNHQYAQITRLPERYPLTTLYYRELMGCPINADIIKCYYEAQPGDYQGRLGFDLVAVFETFPKLDLPLLGEIQINDQYAEEAFTFYDHPKVFIFKKNADFDPEQVRAALNTVDLSKVVRLTPRQFDDFSTLLLPAERLATQRAGGTWSQLFDYDWLQNKYPVIGLLIWYLFILVLGLAAYPIIRIAMPGLADKGYPLSRALGLLLLAYLSWLAGSLGIPYTRTTIAVAFGALLLTGAALGWHQRAELREEWQTKRKYFLTIESLFLAFFLIDLLIRLGNPDMWHPFKGGERPMDFSYFNAVIKSASFPPYDPWFAGGYINYYYYGFVIAGTPVKLLGIVPSIAYNFILPTLFAIVGISAFSIGWNLLSSPLSRWERAEGEGESSSFILHPSSLISGLSASALAILLGNLGTLQLLYQKMQQLGAAGMFDWNAPFFQRLTWAIQGFLMTLKGIPLPIGPGDWYWNPSRVVPPGPDNSITEFPLFTFLYSDLHAHMLVMPIALLALSWALSVVAARARWKNQASPEFDRRASAGLGIVIGALIAGAAYPTNLSDSYTYLLICIIALGYSILRYSETANLYKRIGLAAGAAAAFYLLARLLYEPYRIWYSQAYSALEPWRGPFTPFASYLTMWGVFLFIAAVWMAWETREWMRLTPLSALQKLKPYQLLIEGALVTLVILMLALQFHGTSVGWIAVPLAAWAGVLLLNPHLSDEKRFVLFLIGTALFITILVEVVVVRGDIGRQNTIFKFYLQAWFMLAAACGAALAWTLPAVVQWLPGWRAFWQGMMIFLVSGALLFTITGTSGKIRDRWIREAPHTLDAMIFMEYAQYDTYGQRLNLSEDYRAIRWMQDNVQGSPVIVETAPAGRQYEWHSRFTIYTGLPGVIGWQWHQQQQRVLLSQQVIDRGVEVNDFYNSLTAESARNFLKNYGVRYIIVGQLERAAYTPEGIAKFEQFEGTLWRAVYRDRQTVIYEVLP